MNLLKKRYWVIGYNECYPFGFANDVHTTHWSLKEAKVSLAIVEKECEWSYIFDAEKREIR